MVPRSLGLVVGALAALVSANEPNFDPVQPVQYAQHAQAYHPGPPPHAPTVVVSSHPNSHPTTHAPHPVPSSQQLGCLKPLDCGSLGCRPEPIIGTGTTIVPHTAAPSGLPHATGGGVFVGPNGASTTSWQATHTTILYVPSCSPSAPPCASWVVTHVPTTMVLGTETIIFNEPSITAVGPTPTTVISTKLSISTTTATTTSISYQVVPTTVTSTSTFIIPPVVQTHTATVTYTSTAYAGGVGTTTVHDTTTSTTTSTVTLSAGTPCPSPPIVTSKDCPLCPTQPITTHKPEPTGCVRKMHVDWTNVNIYKEYPPTFTYDHLYGSVFRIQDADTKAERYTVSLDGRLLGATTDEPIDARAHCGILPAARLTCLAQGFSHGQWAIPPGRHAIQVNTLFNHDNDGQSHASTFFYSLEQVCPGDSIQPPQCTPNVIHDWAKAEVYEHRPFRILDTFHYDYPVKISVVDAGYKTEKYIVQLDGNEIGRTHDYDTDQNEYCGTTIDGVETCRHKAFSTGVFVVPPGKHVVVLSSITTRTSPHVEPYSTVFYKIERFCESPIQ